MLNTLTRRKGTQGGCVSLPSPGERSHPKGNPRVSQFRMAAWVGLPWRTVLPSVVQGDNDTHEAARSLLGMRMRGKYTANNFMTDDFDIISIL